MTAPRRAPVLGFVAGLAAALALALAPSAGSAPADNTTRYGVEFALHAEGFEVLVQSDEETGTVRLLLSRGAEFVLYETEATITADAVEAEFGRLGRIDLHFRPLPGSQATGDRSRAGVFEGTFAFTGEHGYVHIDASRIPGTRQTLPAAQPPHGTADPASPPNRAVASREDEVRLQAVDRRGAFARTILSALGSRTSKGPRTVVLGGAIERREGVSIFRESRFTAGVGSAGTGFHWHLDTGRGTVNPGGLFSGAAVFRRRPGRPANWSGSLSVHLLGVARPVELTGSGFRAQLAHYTPHEVRPGARMAPTGQVALMW